MFYSQYFFARQGPLGNIWLAAHFERKLTKRDIFATDISNSVESVLNPENPLALRVSGHLMLGIVIIYSRKVKYLMTDCTEAMWKIKMAFKGSGNLDLPPEALINIVDPRFGYIPQDTDFPELEDQAFSMNMLTKYKTLEAVRGRTIAPERETTERGVGSGIKKGRGSSRVTTLEPVDENEDLINIPVFEGDEVSEIGLTRAGGRHSSLSDTVGRASTSRLSSIRMDDDDLPAFDQPDDLGLGVFGADEPGRRFMSGEFDLPMDQMDEIPPFDGPMDSFHFMDESGIPSEGSFLPSSPIGADDVSSSNRNVNTDDNAAGSNDLPDHHAAGDGPDVGDVTVGKENEDQDAAVVDPDPAQGADTDAPPKRKQPKSNKPKLRKRVVVDEKVELTNRYIEECRNNVKPITRRDVNDPQFPYPRDVQRISAQEKLCRSSLKNICPQLSELFDMTLRMPSLPFALKRDLDQLVVDVRDARQRRRRRIQKGPEGESILVAVPSEGAAESGGASVGESGGVGGAGGDTTVSSGTGGAGGAGGGGGAARTHDSLDDSIELARDDDHQLDDGARRPSYLDSSNEGGHTRSRFSEGEFGNDAFPPMAMEDNPDYFVEQDMPPFIPDDDFRSSFGVGDFVVPPVELSPIFSDGFDPVSGEKMMARRSGPMGSLAISFESGEVSATAVGAVNTLASAAAAGGGGGPKGKGKGAAGRGGDEAGVEGEEGGGGLTIRNIRTAAVLRVLKEELRAKKAQAEDAAEGAENEEEQQEEDPKVSFFDISNGISRRGAASSFLEILQLKTWGYLELAQGGPFGDLEISATEKTWAS